MAKAKKKAASRKPAPRAAAREKTAKKKATAKAAKAPIDMQPSRAPAPSRGAPPDGVGKPHDTFAQAQPGRDIRTQTEATWLDDVTQTKLMPFAPVFVRWGLGVYRLGLLLSSPESTSKPLVQMIKVNERGNYVAEFGPTPVEVDADQVSRVYMERDWDACFDPKSTRENVSDIDARMSRGPATDPLQRPRDQPNVLSYNEGGRDDLAQNGMLTDSQTRELCSHILDDKPITPRLLRALARWAREVVDVDDVSPASSRMFTVTPVLDVEAAMRAATFLEEGLAPDGATKRSLAGWIRQVAANINSGLGPNGERRPRPTPDEMVAASTELLARSTAKMMAPETPAPRDVKAPLPPGVPSIGSLVSVRTGGRWEVVRVTGYSTAEKLVSFIADDSTESTLKMSEKDRTWRELSNAERARYEKATRTAPVATHDEITPEQLAAKAEEQRAQVDRQANDAALEAAGVKPAEKPKREKKKSPVDQAVDHAKVMPKKGHVICIMALGKWTPTKVSKVKETSFEVPGGLVLSIEQHGKAWIHVHEVPRESNVVAEVQTTYVTNEAAGEPKPIDELLPSVSAPRPLSLHQRNLLAVGRLGISLDEVMRRREAGTLELGPEDREHEAEQRRAREREQAGLGPNGYPLPDADELAVASDRELRELGKRRTPSGEIVDDRSMPHDEPSPNFAAGDFDGVDDHRHVEDLDSGYVSSGRMPWE